MATNVYQYIAENRPQESIDLIAKYGYSTENVQDSFDLAECLNQLVASEGENPLYEMADLHPDSHLIIEAYELRQGSHAVSNDSGCNCGCKNNKNAAASYIEAATQSISNNGFLTINQNGILLIGGLLIITLALIATKN